MTVEKIGFIGLGNIGKPMAMNLVDKGFDLTVFDIRPEPVAELEAMGASAAQSARGLAENNGVILSMVRDTSDTKQVLFGKESLWEGMKPGSTVVISSTIDPQFVRELSAKGTEKGIAVFDASVSGGAVRAREGSLSIMVGGTEKSLKKKYGPLFEAMGNNVYYLGSVGNGLVAKLVNNAMTCINMVGTIEALRLGVRAGADAKLLLQVIRTSSGKSWVADEWERYERNIRDYLENPKGSVIQLLYKDADLALDLAKEAGVNMPFLALMSQLDIGCVPGD